MNKDFAIAGKILNIDLSRRQIVEEATPSYSDRFLGGLGISLWKFLREMPRSTSPFDPENIIAFGAGLLGGTMAPGACRVSIASKNVFTGGLGSANAGGFWAPELKYAGFDHVFIKGKSEKPVYLLIDNGEVSLEDASPLWGLTTWDTEDALRKKIGKNEAQFLSIGPAGENRVKAAAVIVSRSRAAARCGLGAVMGSKHLKAIAVKGSGRVEVADPEGFMEACWEMSARILRTETVQKIRSYGTPVSFVRWNAQSALPTHNFQRTQMDLEKAGRISHVAIKENFIDRSFSCFSCPIHCSQFQKIKSGQHKGIEGEKIECQTLWDFGAKLGIDDPSAIIRAGLLCTQLGLDIDNVSGAISWAFECFQRGILTERDTDGLCLRWGDQEVVLELIRKIAHREGFGDLLAKGSREASGVVGKGSEKYSIHVKGQELAEELRAFKAWALGVTVAARGGAHTMGAPLTERMTLSEELSQKLYGIPTASNPDTYEGKARLVAYYERFHAILDALGMCFFTSNWMGPDLLGPKDCATLYNLATGNHLSEDELLEIGEKVHNLAKIFNVRHADFGRKDDYPPERLLKEPTTGSQSGLRLDEIKWSDLLDEYYDLHGWNRGNGFPKRETLAKLGLLELVSESS
jgi:aldehyde:ferredoxin oxidoreductase